MPAASPAGASLPIDPRQWVDRHGDALFRFAFARVGHRAIAEDLVQDTLLAALRAISSFRSDASERTWLVSILKRRIVDHFRREYVRCREQPNRDPVDLSPFFSPAGKWKPTPQRWIAARPGESDVEFQHALEACLDALPPTMRAAVAMREIADDSTETVCKVLALTPTNLWTLLHRARLRLRACLESNWFSKS